MKKTVLLLIATLQMMITSGYCLEVESFLQANTFELRPDKVNDLKKVATSGCEEDRLTAHALLCADYLRKDNSENLYSNVIYHAEIVLNNSKTNWQTIYVQFTVLVMHSSGYLPDYKGQIKRANSLKEALSAYAWDNNTNPIFAHLASPEQLTKKKLTNMVDYFLVQAYSKLAQPKNARDILDKMSDAQLKDSALNVIKSYESQNEKLER